MDVLGFEERREGADRRVRVRAKRGAEFVRKSLLSRADRTLTPTSSPKGEGRLCRQHHLPFANDGIFSSQQCAFAKALCSNETGQ